MEITYKNKELRLKGKTGVLYSRPNGFLIESSDGSSKKELFGAGEYEVSGISVIGIKNGDSVIFVYEVDGIRICNLEFVSAKLSDTKVSSVGDIDVLLVPDSAESIEMMQQIESYYVLPINFSSEDSLNKFLTESGLVVERMPKLSLKKDELIEDSAAQIVVLSS